MPGDMLRIMNEGLKDLVIVKEIDFHNDIDVHNSARYYIDQEKKGLRVFCEEKEKLKLENCSLLFGKAKSSGSGIDIIPEVSEAFGDMSFLSASLLFDRVVFDNDKDAVYVDFNYQDASYFYVRLINRELYKYVHRVSNEEKDQGVKQVQDISARSVDFMFYNNHLRVAKRIGTKLEYIENIPHVFEDKSVEIVISKKNRCILVNGRKYRAPMLDFLSNNGIYLSIIAFIDNKKSKGSVAHIKDLICGKSEGYLYLNPMDIGNKDLKVFISYSGNPGIQYFSNRAKKWIDIRGDQTIHVQQLLNMRIRAGLNDYIYKMIFAENR